VSSVLSVTLPFFAIIGCGWLSRRLNLLPETAVSGMTVFVFTFALPALLFRSSATRHVAEIADLEFLGLYLLALATITLVTVVVGRVLFRPDLSGTGIHVIGAGLGNLGFMGLPLISGLLGQEALTPMILILTVDTLVMVPLGLAILEMGRSGGGDVGLVKRTWRAARGSLFNPLVVAIAAGIGASLLSLPLPQGVDNFLSLLGAAAGPTALFSLGASLYGRPISEGLGEVGCVVSLKLLVFPLIMAAIMLGLYGGDPLWAKAAILVAALPTAGNVYVIASRYGVRVTRASTVVLFSTAVASATFSLLAWIW
jgi:predicted permease